MKYDFQAAREHFAARNAFTTGPHELVGMIDAKADIVIVDVRFPTDYRKAHVPGAVNLPKGKWHEPKGLAKDKLNGSPRAIRSWRWKAGLRRGKRTAIRSSRRSRSPH
jgi:rhodanese-related sulfurtransferase